MRYLFLLLATVAFIGCKPQPEPPDLPKDLPEVNTTEMIVLDDLPEDFQMAPPSFVQAQEEKMLGKFLWEKCLPPYENGEKPILPASVE